MAAHSLGATPPGGDTSTGIVAAGKLDGADVLLAILDDPPRVLRRSASGTRSWPAPAQVGALAAGARPGEIVVAAAWADARVPRAEIWWLVDGTAQRHCTWQAPSLERWKSQPRGASAVLSFAGGAIVAGVDGSLVEFDASCTATARHDASCCDGEKPLHLRASATGWAAYDLRGATVYPAGEIQSAGCAPAIDRPSDPSAKGAIVRGARWSATIPELSADARVVDWSDACDAVLVAAGTHAWTCRETGCSRVR